MVLKTLQKEDEDLLEKVKYFEETKSLVLLTILGLRC